MVVLWAHLRLEICDFCTPANLCGCKICPSSSVTYSKDQGDRIGFCREDMSKGLRYRGTEGTSEKMIQVINQRVQSHFSVCTQKNGK